VAEEDLPALKAGLANLGHHIESIRKFGLPVVVAINRFPTDTDAELETVREYCEQKGVRAAISEVVTKGGEGGRELAQAVLEVLESEPSNFRPLYDWSLPIKEKLETIAREVYGADGVVYTANAEKDIALCTELGLNNLPVCVAKTQHSITDDPNVKGAPRGFKITVREVRPAPGAGFLVCLTGDVMTMPGLPKKPAAEEIDLTEDGVITGLR